MPFQKKKTIELSNLKEPQSEENQEMQRGRLNRANVKRRKFVSNLDSEVWKYTQRSTYGAYDQNKPRKRQCGSARPETDNTVLT